MSRCRASLALGVVVALLASAAAAQEILAGEFESGAHYNIQVPNGWSPGDGLAIWNHDFVLTEPGPPNLGPLAGVQLNEGLAVAASSFSLTGWALASSEQDTSDLYQEFVSEFGNPGPVYITGRGTGAAVAIQIAEKRTVPNVRGVLPICGALSGSRIWDGALDHRLLYNEVCGDVPGAAIPRGGGPTPLDVADTFNRNGLVQAVDTCFQLSNPLARTVAQQQRLLDLRAATGLNELQIFQAIDFAVFGLDDLLNDPAKFGGRMPFTNAHVDYGDAEINLSIDRLSALPDERSQLFANYTPSGRLGNVKVVSIHTDEDPVIPVENAGHYGDIAHPTNYTVGVVDELIPTHCGFSEAETVAAWESLRGWALDLGQPTPQDLQNTCNALVLGGQAEGPCRIDPGFVMPDLDDRVRLRDVCIPDANTTCLRDGRFRLEVSWKDFAGNTGVGTDVGFNAPNDTAFWFFSPDNIELVVKVLDGRRTNGRFWVFYGSLTNVEFELTVTDTETSLIKTYENNLGNFASVGDSDAF